MQQRWYSVDEKQPECGERVIVCIDDFVGEGFLGNKAWFRYDQYDFADMVGYGKVTHWMPFPKPYGKEKEHIKGGIV